MPVHETVTIPVTLDINADDIKQGRKGDCYKCPAALAALRALAEFGVTWAAAGSNDLSAGYGPMPAPHDGGGAKPAGCVTLFHASHPETLRYWIRGFDTNSEAKPISVAVGLRFDQ